MFYSPFNQHRNQTQSGWVFGEEGFLWALGKTFSKEIRRTEKFIHKVQRIGKEVNRSSIQDLGKEFFIRKVKVSLAEFGEDNQTYLDLLAKQQRQSTFSFKEEDRGRNSPFKKIDRGVKITTEDEELDQLRIDELVSLDLAELPSIFGDWESSNERKNHIYLKHDKSEMMEMSIGRDLLKVEDHQSIHEQSLSQIDMDQEILRVYSNPPSYMFNTSKNFYGNELHSIRNKLVVLHISFESNESILNNHCSQRSSNEVSCNKSVFERKILVFDIKEKGNDKKPLMLGNKVLERVQLVNKLQGVKELVDRVAAYRRGDIKDPNYSQNLLTSQIRCLFEENFHCSFFIDFSGVTNQNQLLNLSAFTRRLKQLEQKVRIVSPWEIREELNMFDSVCEFTQREGPLPERVPDCESRFVDKIDYKVVDTNVMEANCTSQPKVKDLSKTRNVEVEEFDQDLFAKNQLEDEENVPEMKEQANEFSRFFKEKRREIGKSMDNSQRRLKSLRKLIPVKSASNKRVNIPGLSLLKQRINRLVEENKELREEVKMLKKDQSHIGSGFDNIRENSESLIDREVGLGSPEFQNINHNKENGILERSKAGQIFSQKFKNQKHSSNKHFGDLNSLMVDKLEISFSYTFNKKVSLDIYLSEILLGMVTLIDI